MKKLKVNVAVRLSRRIVMFIGLILMVIAITMNGCAKNEKRSATSPDLATDTAAATQELASSILDSIVEGFSSSTSGTSSSPFLVDQLSLAPNLGIAGPMGIGKAYFSTTPDSEGYYTVDSTVFKNTHPFWKKWATVSLAVKVKEVDAAAGDIIGDWLAGSTKLRKNRTQPITFYRIIEAENDNKKVKDELSHSVDFSTLQTGSNGLIIYGLTVANGVTVKVTKTNKLNNVIHTAIVKSIDEYIADGRWLHQLTADYNDTAGKKSNFNLTRNNDITSGYFGYHTGDGIIYFNDEIVAKVHLNGDGTGYYTLASENFATQHEFNNERDQKANRTIK